MMYRCIKIIYALLLGLVIVFLTTCINVIYADDIYSEFLDLYTEVAKLAQQGIDVSSIVEKLREAHDALTSGGNPDLSVIRAEIDYVKREASKMILYQNLVKGFSIVGLISVPILIYLLLPRIYLYMWYKSRRRWVVKVESS